MWWFAVAAVISAAVTVAQSQAQSKAAKASARLQERRADAIREATDFKAEQHRRRVKRFIASQRATVGAAGVALEGSPLEAIEESAAEGELDALMIKYSGSIEESDARASAALDRYRAKSIKTSGYLSAAAQIANGFAKSYGGGASAGGGGSGGGANMPPHGYGDAYGI